MEIGTCLDYRGLYLSFGFEAINDRATRREILDQALDWLTAPPPSVGIEAQPISQTHIGPPGMSITHTLRIRHIGQSGITDTVSLSLDGTSWATQISALSLPLAPCTFVTVVVTVTVPITANWDERDVITLAAQSSLSPTLVQTAVLTSKAPAPILLVDDDRWYDEEAKYQAALADGGFHHDYWHTGKTDDEAAQGSPPLSVLQRYPIIVWYTAYDWYEPMTADEEATLATYLDGGGRLFLTSQDFLYHRYGELLSQNYLGVLTYTEDVTPTLAQGVPEDPIGDRSGPHPLSYPFQNWSDAVMPAPGTAIPFRDQEHRPIALARQNLEKGYRTVFFSFPFEALLQAGRAEVMKRVIGWLSWLGSSSFTADRGAISSGDTLTYTIALGNDGPETASMSLSNTLPISLTLVPGSLTGPAAYDPSARRISWEGPLEPGEAVTVTYRATAAAGLPAGATIANVASLELEDQELHFNRQATVRVDTPDLSTSALSCGPAHVRPGALVTCTLALVNTGPGDTPAATATILLPADVTFIPDSLTWTDGGTTKVLTGTVHWGGPLSAGHRLTLTYQVALPGRPIQLPLYSVALLEDGMEGAWERAAWLPVEPWSAYLPATYRDFWKPWWHYLPLIRSTSGR